MQDILLDTDFEPMFANGDFATGESTEQHQELLLACSKGDFKENPTVCVGAAGWLKSEDVSGLLAEIKQEFERDGMTVIKLELAADKLYSNAHY